MSSEDFSVHLEIEDIDTARATVIVEGEINDDEKIAAIATIISEASANALISLLVVDLSKTSYINSAGLRLLEKTHHNLEPGRQLGVVGLSPRIENVFKIVGFNNFLMLAPSLGDLLTLLAKADAQK